jgi:hypothetical protein
MEMGGGCDPDISSGIRISPATVLGSNLLPIYTSFSDTEVLADVSQIHNREMREFTNEF